jgi:hypothetical protein
MSESIVIVSDKQAERFQEIQSETDLDSTQLLRRMNNLWEGLSVLEREYAEITGGLTQLTPENVDTYDADD